jgi:glycosyltransferase involved in cell wall biosynthesis/SAM-dependent methyltransferase
MRSSKSQKLLIVTQAVDSQDPVLGFFISWIEEFAAQVEQLLVFALRVGDVSLPENVRVVPLRVNGAGRVAVVVRECWKAWRCRHEYDAVFVHMNVEHVIAVGWLWRLLGKRVVLWYTHGTVSMRLRVALFFASEVCTASEQSMRIVTRKKRVLGHGLPFNDLSPVQPPSQPPPLQLLTVGRIAPVKGLEMLIAAVALLAKKGRPAVLTIIGTGEVAYIRELQTHAKLAGINDAVIFPGPLPHARLAEAYRGTHLFLHASKTGSLDKAPLEALALGVPVITLNPEIADGETPLAFLSAQTPEALSAAIEEAADRKIWNDISAREAASAYIRENFGLPRLVAAILAETGTAWQDHSMEKPVEGARTHFNTVAKESPQGSYEDRRWAANTRVRQQYASVTRFMHLKVLPIVAGADSILELGPGPGTWTKLICGAAPHARLVLTDISREMLSRAKTVPLVEPEVREGDFLSVEAQPGEFDFFFSSRAIEYVDDKERAAKKISELLSEGGHGCIITKMPKPTANALTGRKQSALHQGQIAPRTLTRYLSESGCTDLELYPVTFGVPLLRSATADRLAGWLLGRFHLTPLSSFFAESYAVLFDRP